MSSYLEMRSFVEVMKSLRYPRFISLDSFVLPNFELMSDCLLWLYNRFDPEAKLSKNAKTPQERVTLVKAIAEGLLLKAGVKINLKRLYASNTPAVKELLRLALLLYQANIQDVEPVGHGDIDVVEFSAPLQSLDLSSARRLVTEVTRCGAELFDSLQKEMEVGENRERVLAQNLDIEAAEMSISEAVRAVQEALQALQRTTKELHEEKRLTQGKLERKVAELDRHTKRLATLSSVRPAHMAEYEQLQQQLEGFYRQYTSKFRNLQYMRFELDRHRMAEAEAMEDGLRHQRKLQKRLKQEELRILRGDVQEGSDDDSDSDDSADGQTDANKAPSNPSPTPQEPRKASLLKESMGPFAGTPTQRNSISKMSVEALAFTVARVTSQQPQEIATEIDADDISDTESPRAPSGGPLGSTMSLARSPSTARRGPGAPSAAPLGGIRRESVASTGSAQLRNNRDDSGRMSGRGSGQTDPRGSLMRPLSRGGKAFGNLMAEEADEGDSEGSSVEIELESGDEEDQTPAVTRTAAEAPSSAGLMMSPPPTPGGAPAAAAGSDVCTARHLPNARKPLSTQNEYKFTPNALLKKLDLMTNDLDDIGGGCGVPLQQFEFGSQQAIKLTMAEEVVEGAPLTVLEIDGDLVPTEGFRSLQATVGQGKKAVQLKYTARTNESAEEYTITSDSMVLRLTAEPGQPHLCLTAMQK